MFRSGKGRFVAVPLALLFLFAFAPIAHATPPPNQLDLTITGSVGSSGQQDYTQSGGEVVYASILGQVVNSSTAVFTENLSASVDGLVTSGTAYFSLSGEFLNGTSFAIGGAIGIVDAVPAEAFPLGCWDGITLPLPPACTSQVPAFFVGLGALSGTVPPSQPPLWMDLESAYLNPGPLPGPIVWASTDGSVVIVFSYVAATIDWHNIQTNGSLVGTLGATPVSGSFSMTTNAHEDLFAGTEAESGTMTFYGMNPSYLDASGAFTGSSTIPTSNAIDCSSITGIAGTCTETGLASSGSFTLDPGNALIQGSYDIDWTVPAFSFSGTSAALVSQGGVTGVPEFGAGALAPVAMGVALLLLLRRDGLRARARN
ncbi:MAG: hypothetical protein ABSB26_07900 [Nitrososphaerales archaeon]